jgi:hypothetical protein
MPELAFLVNRELSGGFTATCKTLNSHNKSLFGRIAVEWPSVLAWNHYPDYCGILIRFPVESLTGLAWNIQSWQFWQMM